MSDGQGRKRVDASYVYGGLLLHVKELDGGWRVSYGGKEIEHAHLDYPLAGALGRAPGSVLHLVRGILEGQPGTELGS